MAHKTLETSGRTTVETKGASTPNLRVIREAAQQYADNKSKSMPREVLLRRVGAMK